jgi:hypothetical protein
MRGISFELTFDEWWDVWEKSGKWNLRGNRPGKFVMCRTADQGAYKIGNVFITEFNRNFLVKAAKRPRKRVRSVEKETTALD